MSNNVIIKSVVNASSCIVLFLIYYDMRLRSNSYLRSFFNWVNRKLPESAMRILLLVLAFLISLFMWNMGFHKMYNHPVARYLLPLTNGIPLVALIITIDKDGNKFKNFVVYLFSGFILITTMISI